MRVLIDQCIHDLRNKENNAMLEVALNRFGKRWSDASLEVITQSLHVVRLYYPEARPVELNGQLNGSQNQSQAGVLY